MQDKHYEFLQIQASEITDQAAFASRLNFSPVIPIKFPIGHFVLGGKEKETILETEALFMHGIIKTSNSHKF